MDDAMLGTGLMMITTLAALCAVAGGWYTLRLRERLAVLEKQLDIYVETSISVARSVDQLIYARTAGKDKPSASRRYLLQEARRRIESGQSLAQVREDLVLVGDEADLLALGVTSGVTSDVQPGSRQASTAALGPVAESV